MAYYWCYDHRNRNRFFNWKSNRIEIVFFVHPVKRFVHWSTGSLIDAVAALQWTDQTLQGGRSSVIKLFIYRQRPPLSWSEREVTGEAARGRVFFVPCPQTRPTYRYRPIITWHWPGSERWLRCVYFSQLAVCSVFYLSICRPDA